MPNGSTWLVKDSLKPILEWIDFYTFGEEVEIIIDQKDYESSLMIFGDSSVELLNNTFDLDMSLSEGKSMYVAFNSNSEGRSKILIVNKNYYHADHYEVYSISENLKQLIQIFAKTTSFETILIKSSISFTLLTVIFSLKRKFKSRWQFNTTSNF